MAGHNKGQTVGYVRVSSDEQNVARQLEAIGTVDRTFTDRISGKSRSARSGLSEMTAYVRDGDTVLVSSMDRLARSLRDLDDIVSELTGRGVTVRFLKEALTFSPTGNDHFARFQMQLIGAVAELERSLIRERQAEGIAIAKARGVYRRAPKLTAAAVAAAQERIDQKVPLAVIAREVGVSRQTLYTALRRELPPPGP